MASVYRLWAMELAPAWRREYPDVGRQEVDAAQLLSEPCRCYPLNVSAGTDSKPCHCPDRHSSDRKVENRQASSRGHLILQNYDKHQIGKGSLSKNSLPTG